MYIRVAGTSKDTATRENGDYQLAVPSLKDTLIFSFVEFKDRMVPINGRTQINVALKPKKVKENTERIMINCHRCKNYKEPLILIDSIRATHEDLLKLNPDSIAHVNVLKDSANIAKYGSEASGGIILITTKKSH